MVMKTANNCDPSVSKDHNESLVKEQPLAKKKRLNKQGKNSIPLITKLTKTLQLTKYVVPTINGELASLVDEIKREKAKEDKIMELKKQQKLSKIMPPCQRPRSIKVSGTIWTSGLCQLTEFQKVPKSLIKVVMSEVNKLMGNSEIQKEETVCALMDGVLLLANANQELKHQQRELMRPQLNTNYRHLCSLSNPVTAELFGDDLPKAVKDILDTNRLSLKLTKDSSSSHSKSSQ